MPVPRSAQWRAATISCLSGRGARPPTSTPVLFEPVERDRVREPSMADLLQQRKALIAQFGCRDVPEARRSVLLAEAPAAPDARVSGTHQRCDTFGLTSVNCSIIPPCGASATRSRWPSSLSRSTNSERVRACSSEIVGFGTSLSIVASNSSSVPSRLTSKRGACAPSRRLTPGAFPKPCTARRACRFA